MKRGELIGAMVTTAITYLACPDVMDKWETMAFMVVIFGCCIAALWALEECQRRIRVARRIRRRRRQVFDINLRRTGLVEEGTGKEVELIG